MDKKKRIDSSQYAYATGRIRALENHLIGSARLGRYLEARSAEDIGRLLTEDGYPPAADPENSLNRELESTYGLIRSLSPDPDMIDALLLAHDFHNLKVMLKALSVYWPRREAGTPEKTALAIEQLYEGGSVPRTEGEPVQEPSSDKTTLWPEVHGPVAFDRIQHLVQVPATVEPRKLFEALREQKPKEMPPILADVAARAALRYQQSYDISEIDICVDKTLAQSLADAADRFDSPFFSGYIRMKIDLVNIGLLLRTRFLNSGADYLKRILLPGGSVQLNELTALYDGTASMITEKIGRTKMAALTEPAAHFPEGGDAIARFSLASDDMLIRTVQEAKRVLRGPEVLIGYLVAREMEIKTVRVILTCLRNRIPVDKARELARLSYL